MRRSSGAMRSMGLPDAGLVAMLRYAGPPYVGGVELTIAAHGRFLVGRGHPVRSLAANAGHFGRGIGTPILPELGSRGNEIEAVNRELARGRRPPHSWPAPAGSRTSRRRPVRA